jgi:hypothetical protein
MTGKIAEFIAFDKKEAGKVLVDDLSLNAAIP